jgi:hypothetical protein
MDGYQGINKIFMKKNRTIFLVVIVLAILALALFLTQSKTTFRRSMSDFAVKDTSIVTKIFMSDKNNNSLKLTRLEPGKWTVNDKYPAQKQMVDILLSTLSGLEVREPIAKAAHNTIISDMAVNSVKVEIYQMGFRINIFGWIRLFPHEKLEKVYYVGGATPTTGALTCSSRTPPNLLLLTCPDFEVLFHRDTLLRKSTGGISLCLKNRFARLPG